MPEMLVLPEPRAVQIQHKGEANSCSFNPQKQKQKPLVLRRILTTAPNETRESVGSTNLRGGSCQSLFALSAKYGYPEIQHSITVCIALEASLGTLAEWTPITQRGTPPNSFEFWFYLRGVHASSGAYRELAHPSRSAIPLSPR